MFFPFRIVLWRKEGCPCSRCGRKRKGKEELKDDPPLVNGLQENEHLEMQKTEEKEGEFLEMKETIIDFTIKQDSVNKEQAEEQQQEEKLREEEEKLQELKERLVQNEKYLIQREQLVQEKEEELKEKDEQLKLRKVLWLMDEEEQKKQREEQQREKEEAGQRKINEQERKKQEELRIRNEEECRHAKQKKYFQEEREGCEMVWKTKELILLKREQEMRERKHNVEIKTQELLVRETKVKKLEMLDYQQIQEVLEATDEGLQQQQKHQDVHQVPPEPKLKGDDGVQRQHQDVHQVPPEPKLKGDDRVMQQHHDVHQVPPEPKLKGDDGVQQQHQDVHQVPPEPKLKGDDGVQRQHQDVHQVPPEPKLKGDDGVQRQHQDVHQVPPEPKLKGDDGVQQQHQDVHQVPPEPKLKGDDGVQQQHQDVHQVPPEPKLKDDDWVQRKKKQKHVHRLPELNPHGGNGVQQKQQDVHRRSPEPKPLCRDEPAELESRKKNLMFRGLKESKNDMQLVAKLLSVMNLNIKPECTFRVGYVVGKRPVKVVFRSVSDRNLVLYNNNKVRNFNDPSQNSKNIFITPDYTVVEREEQAKLQDHLQEMREIDPNGQYTIKRGKVVKQAKGIHRW
uniref:golgin subfamily A member 6-like protein 22 isoform X3 n=1 Tax=Myxine glutinosa TaxID=7769 RepID=UPI00358EB25A